MKMVNIRVPEAELAAIRAMADAECLTLSAFVRRVLRARAVELALLPDQVQLLKLKGQVRMGDGSVPPAAPFAVLKSGDLFVEAEPDIDDLTSHE